MNAAALTPEDPTPDAPTLGERMIRLLEAYGVEHVFGIPGVHTVELYRGLSNSRIRHVTPRHEQGAGFMADGYARVSGKPGVCLLITGPGLANAATAMGQALADSIPMLVITGVNPRRTLGSGRGHLHELPDQRAFAEQVSVFSQTVFAPDQLDEALARAFTVFGSARPGPVHIEIPLDMMAERWDAPLPAPAVVSAPAPAPEEVERVASALEAAARPVILAGGGARGAADPLRRLAEALGAPVVQTNNARGLLPGEHPLSVPASPSSAAVRALLDDSDLALAVGTELGPTDYDVYEKQPFDYDGRFIRIDIDAQQLGRTPVAADLIRADAGAVLTALGERLAARDPAAGAARAEKTRKAARAELDPAYRRSIEIIERIWAAAPDARLIGDSTQIVYAGNMLCSCPGEGQWFGSSNGFGTLGYALPAAIGARLADPSSPVVCLIGDGGLQFTLPEMASAVEAGAPVIMLLWNNSGYKEIRSFMVDRGIAPEGVDLFTPDFQGLAAAMGWRAARLEALDGLEPALAEALASGTCSMIELPEEVALAGL